MAGEDAINGQMSKRWHIDLDWYQQNSRSFVFLAGDRLCSDCRQQLNVDVSGISVQDLLTSIKDCASNSPDFINVAMPVLESLFRLFLLNGNRPLDIEELSSRLSEWRAGDSQRTSAVVLSRLLESDQYYGFKPVGG